jgi:hypothetical protein
MSRRRLAPKALAFALVCAPLSARAITQPPPGQSPQANTNRPLLGPPRWDHARQFALRAGIGMGYSFTIRYSDRDGTDPCDDGGNKFCVGASPLMLDTALAFGATRGLELEARFRLGFTTNFDDSRPLQAGFGLRLLTDETRGRFFIGAAVLADFTDGRRNAGGDLDLLLRAEEGWHFDASRWFGFYIAAGETFGFLRNFSCVIDLNLGVQFRAPP